MQVSIAMLLQPPQLLVNILGLQGRGT